MSPGAEPESVVITLSSGAALLGWPALLPAVVMTTAKQSVGAALGAAHAISVTHPAAAAVLRVAANHAFFSGFKIGCVVAAAVALGGAVMAAILLPSHPTEGSLLMEDRSGAPGERVATPAVVPLPVGD
jgi:hypothetical protein